jgi:hypothetical protein
MISLSKLRKYQFSVDALKQFIFYEMSRFGHVKLVAASLHHKSFFPEVCTFQRFLLFVYFTL